MNKHEFADDDRGTRSASPQRVFKTENGRGARQRDGCRCCRGGRAGRAIAAALCEALQRERVTRELLVRAREHTQLWARRRALCLLRARLLVDDVAQHHDVAEDAERRDASADVILRLVRRRRKRRERRTVSTGTRRAREGARERARVHGPSTRTDGVAPARARARARRTETQRTWHR